jgi:hypothetical protein
MTIAFAAQTTSLGEEPGAALETAADCQASPAATLNQLRRRECMLLPLLVAALALVGSLVLYGVATTIILHLVVHLIRTGYSGLSIWRNVAFMALVSLVTAVAHLIQIALWAAALLLVGAFPTFDKALYYSAQSYTAVGYGDIVVSEHWRLLGPLESINGLLLFGLSTAVMFAVMSRLIKNRLRLKIGDAYESEVTG